MKKIIFTLIAAIGFNAVVCYSCCAQNSWKGTEPDFDKDFLPSVRNLAMLSNPDIKGAYLLNRNEVNLHAVRDFLDRFEMVRTALWFSIPEGGMEAYFVQDGFGDRVVYDKKGRWKFSLITYGDNKFDRDLRAIIKSVYFDFNIIEVQELNCVTGTEWLVLLEDKLMIKIVKLNREKEMEFIQDIEK
jgi:hypothetical protein